MASKPAHSTRTCPAAWWRFLLALDGLFLLCGLALTSTGQPAHAQQGPTTLSQQPVVAPDPGSGQGGDSFSSNSNENEGSPSGPGAGFAIGLGLGLAGSNPEPDACSQALPGDPFRDPAVFQYAQQLQVECAEWWNGPNLTACIFTCPSPNQANLGSCDTPLACSQLASHRTTTPANIAAVCADLLQQQIQLGTVLGTAQQSLRTLQEDEKRLKFAIDQQAVYPTLGTGATYQAQLTNVQAKEQIAHALVEQGPDLQKQVNDLYSQYDCYRWNST